MEPSSVHLNTERTWRGGEQQTLWLVAGLRRRGHRAQLVASPRSELFRRARIAGLEPIGIHAFNEGDPQAVLRLASLLRRERPAIFHLHTSHAHLLGLLAAGLSPPMKRVVARRVDFSIFRHSFLHLNWIKYRWGIDRYITVSRAVRDLLERDGIPGRKIAVVHSGVDPARFDPRPAPDSRGLLEELGLPPDLPIIASLGALYDHKGHRYLVEAAPLILRRRDAAFVVAGEGPRRARLAALARRLGVADRFRLLGFRSDVGRLLSSASVFAFPSIEEGLGTSLLDALLLERPVVATAVGGIPEVISDREQGILVPPRDAEALARGILESLEDPVSALERARRGRARVLAEFSVDGMVEGTLGVYRDILNQGHCQL